MIVNNVTYSALMKKKIEPHVQRAGAQWKPIEHKWLINHFLDIFECKDYKLALSKDGQDFACSFPVRDKSLPYLEGMQYHFALSNSMNQRRQLQFFGGVVTEKGNGLVLAKNPARAKNRKGTDMEAACDQALAFYMAQAKNFRHRIENLMMHHIKDEVGYRILFAAQGGNLMPGSRVFQVDQCFRKGVGGYKGQTAWTLLNAFSKVCQRNPPHRQLRQLWEFYSLVAAVVKSEDGRKKAAR